MEKINNTNFKSGYIALVGRANAGKSTLLNSLIEQKVSIVSPKPQTTRNTVLGIWSEEDCQMIFLDTPGYLRSENMLGDFMLKCIDVATEDVDCILVAIDGHKGIGAHDIELLNKYKDSGCPVVAVITKQDLTQKEKLMPELSKLSGLDFIKDVWVVSARRKKNIFELRNYLKQFLNGTEAYFEKDDYTDRPMAFLVCEIIREKILLALSDEIPHGTGVMLNKMEFVKESGMWDIDANILIEKASHKPIIIGKKGEMLKGIGIEARKSIEKMVGARIHLALWVKIKEGWRDSQYYLKEVGYDMNDIK